MKILILDAAFSATPIYKALIDQGHDVWVMGNRAADILAIQFPLRWIKQDYSKVDEVRDHLDNLNIELVVPGCTDVSIDTAAALGCGKFNGDSVETNKKLSDKLIFRKICEFLGIPSPRIVDERTLPRPGMYICKPVDSFSGKGISKFDGNDTKKYQSALKFAKSVSKSNSALVETYVEGNLYSFSAFIESSKITHSFIVIEGSSANPYAVDTSYVIDKFPTRYLEILYDSIEKIAYHLSLTDGLVHAQFILTQDGPQLIEITRRCPGDLYSILIEMSTGFNYAAKYASYFIKKNIEANCTMSNKIIRHTISSREQIKFSSLHFHKPIPVLKIFQISNVGDTLLPKQASRVGVLFSQHSDQASLETTYKQFIDREIYDIH